MRLLVVEDEMDLCDTIAEGFRMDGYAVDCCYDGAEAYELISVEKYDLVILDLNLPEMDGLEIIRKVRSVNQEIKILVLSARSQVQDKVVGLDLGANDYLGKPFDFEELEARVRNLLRRKFTQEKNLLCFDAITLDLTKRICMIYEKECMLTKKEFSLLEYFLLNQDKTISQEELIEHVWDKEADSFSNAVRVHIATLRKKLKAELTYDVIQTRIKEGYYLTKGENQHDS